MTPEQFCYWMQGFVEINGNCPTEEQWVIIKDHMKLVFNKQTPNRKIEDIINQFRPIDVDPLKVTC